MNAEKRTPWLLVIAATLLFVPSALSVWWALRFTIMDFEVQNDGPVPIRVIAMGTQYERILPLWSRSSPEFQQLIAPGGRSTFQYNWDGVNLCWLLVDAGDGRLHVLRTRLEGKKCELSPPTRRPCCYALDENTVLAVPALEQLDPAPEALTSLLAGP